MPFRRRRDGPPQLFSAFSASLLPPREIVFSAHGKATATAWLYLRDVHRPRIEVDVQACCPNAGIVNLQDDVVPAGRWRAPGMPPQAPGGRARGLRARLYADVRFIGAEPDDKRVGRMLAAPEDADDAVEDAAVNGPLLHANRHRGMIDDSGRVIARALRLTVLKRARCELLHLLRRGRVVRDDVN